MPNENLTGIPNVLAYFNEKFQPRDAALNKVVNLKGRVVDRIGENLRIEILHPDGSGTHERVDLNAWEVSLLNNTHPQDEAERGDSGHAQRELNDSLWTHKEQS